MRVVLFETTVCWPQPGSAFTSLSLGSCSQDTVTYSAFFLCVQIMVLVVEKFLLNPPKAGQGRRQSKGCGCHIGGDLSWSPDKL